MDHARACAVLGVKPTAKPEEVRRAWRRVARATHPDKKPGREADFKEAQQAYELLTSATPLRPAAAAAKPTPPSPEWRKTMGKQWPPPPPTSTRGLPESNTQLFLELMLGLGSRFDKIRKRVMYDRAFLEEQVLKLRAEHGNKFNR